MDAGARVDGRGYHCRLERLSAVPHLYRVTMYRSILVAVENSAADQTILTHVRDLARLTGASLLLVHVADGWAARHFDELKLRESEEMKADRAYLEQLQNGLRAEGLRVEVELAMGDPATELVRSAETQHADLIAMA